MAGPFLKGPGLLVISFTFYEPDNTRKLHVMLNLVVLQEEVLQECLIFHTVEKQMSLSLEF